MSRRARDQSATPARNTRGNSQTPLPGIVTKQSHAYGAQGKTNLHTQVRASGSNFAEDFTTGRITRSRVGSAQPSEDAEGAASPAKKGGLRQRMGRPPRPEPVVEEESEASEEEAPVAGAPTDPGRTQTALGQGLGYGPSAPAAQGAGMVYAIQEPSAWRILLPFLLRCIGVCCLGILLYVWVPLPEWFSEFRFQQLWGLGMVFGIPGYEKPPGYATELWYRVRHDLMVTEMLPNHNMPEIQWAVNLNVLERLNQSEYDRKDLHHALGLHRETLDYLKSILPVTVVLQDGDEPSYTIPQTFWQALAQRIAQGGDEVSPLWDSFISSNQQQILQLTWNAADTIVSQATENKQLVSRDDFVEALEKHNLDLAERYTQDFRRMWEQNIQAAAEIAQKTTEETMRNLTTDGLVKRQLKVLGEAVDLQNTYQALRTYNWFNAGEGATIDPHLTSPTAKPQRKKGLFSWLWGNSFAVTIAQNAPATVLLPWTEVTDCWCAAPNKDGYAQITMQLDEPVHPESLIIEHMPAGGTRNIATAPRHVEVWGEMDSAEEAQRMKEKLLPDMTWKTDPEACTRPPPTDRHICIGSGDYQIHYSNHVQSIYMGKNAKEKGLAVRRFTVRIVNNWGGQRTCLYRLRLLGEEVYEKVDNIWEGD